MRHRQEGVISLLSIVERDVHLTQKIAIEICSHVYNNGTVFTQTLTLHTDTVTLRGLQQMGFQLINLFLLEIARATRLR